MDPSPHICGVTVNHGTSPFVELMLRTLYLTNDLSGLRFEMTVLDNQSDDPGRGELQAYLAAQGVAFTQTGYNAGVATEKHGAALTYFVHDHPECTHYLFLDADMWFIEPDTIAAMIEELAAAPRGTFAVQARIIGYYAGRIIEGEDGVTGPPPSTVTLGDRTYTQVVMPRCSPVCSLVANTPLFRRVVAAVGLAPAYRYGVHQVFYYDTFGLMTQVMATHRRHHIVSARSVNHFTQVAYVPEHRAVKDRDCRLLLDELRAGRGMRHESFYESEWVRQQRQQQ